MHHRPERRLEPLPNPDLGLGACDILEEVHPEFEAVLPLAVLAEIGDVREGLVAPDSPVEELLTTTIGRYVDVGLTIVVEWRRFLVRLAIIVLGPLMQVGRRYERNTLAEHAGQPLCFLQMSRYSTWHLT